jgi:hypothetical protein
MDAAVEQAFYLNGVLLTGLVTCGLMGGVLYKVHGDLIESAL